MAAMSTALTEYSNNGDSRTSALSTHTFSKPNIVIEKRKTPVGSQTVAEYSVSVIYATEDSNGDVLSSKVAFTGTFRAPINGTASDITTALATFRDIIAGDEFANSVNTLEWLT
jgi:hypothetical protein